MSVVTVGNSGVLFVWSYPDLEVKRKITLGKQCLKALPLPFFKGKSYPNNNLLAVASRASLTYIVDLEKEEDSIIDTITDFGSEVWGISLLGSNLLATVGWDQKLRIFDLLSPELKLVRNVSTSRSYCCVSINTGERRGVVIAGDINEFYDYEQDKTIPLRGVSSTGNYCISLKNDKYFAISHDDYTVSFFKSSTLEFLGKCKHSKDSYAWSMAYDDINDVLYLSGYEGSMSSFRGIVASLQTGKSVSRQYTHHVSVGEKINAILVDSKLDKVFICHHSKISEVCSNASGMNVIRTENRESDAIYGASYLDTSNSSSIQEQRAKTYSHVADGKYCDVAFAFE